MAVPPTRYDLEAIKGLIRNDEFTITVTAQKTALAVRFDTDDICRCIVDFLAPTHFYKMTQQERGNLPQDVYRITFEGVRLYVKLQIAASGKAVIVSFKEDEDIWFQS